MSAHAKLAPSSSSRWMTCPGSVALLDRFEFAETTNDAALRGTEAHELAESVLNKAPLFFDEKFTESTLFYEILGDVDEWLQDMVKPYINYLATVPGEKMYENIVRIDDHCWGTADCLSFDEETGVLHVIDLKTGRIRVFAEDNTQLLLYALGAFVSLHNIRRIVKKIKMVIVQPSLNHISEYEINIDDLNSFSVQYEDSVNKILTQPETFNVSDKACKWCDAKIVCPAFKQHIKECAVSEFNENILDEALADWLDMLPALKSIISSVENEARERMNAFREIPGYELSAQHRTRRFNVKELKRIAKSRGLMNKLFPRVPITPAAADKLVLPKSISDLLDSTVEVTLGNSRIIKSK